jgi:hypothetical protein
MALTARRQALRRIFIILRNQALSESNSNWDVYMCICIPPVFYSSINKIPLTPMFCYFFGETLCFSPVGWSIIIVNR